MLFHVDAAKCSHCGCCSAGCVCGLIKTKPDGEPYVEEAAEQLCVHCGHCAAVCPEEAVTLDGTDPASLEHIDTPPSASCVESVVKTRRSIRNFEPSAVDPALLKKAFSLAGYAPTAHNARQVCYTVINGRSKVQKLLDAVVRLMEEHLLYPKHTQNVRTGHDTLLRGAPCLILIHAPERLLSEADCATAASYLELVLPSLNLGSCWAGMLIEACAYGLPKEIQLPEGHKLYAALMVGIPQVAYKRIPLRSSPEITWIS